MSCPSHSPRCHGGAGSVLLHICDACLDAHAVTTGEPRQYLHCVCATCTAAEQARPWPERRWRHPPPPPLVGLFGGAPPDENYDVGPEFRDMDVD